MVDMLYKAMKYMNAEDAMIARVGRGGQTKEERKTGRSTSKQRKEVGPNKWPKGLQEIKASTGEENELYSFKYPVGSSP